MRPHGNGGAPTASATSNTAIQDITKRIADAVKYARDQLIRVGKTGIILDGHHRVADAIANGRAIDVFVEFYK